MTEEELYNMSDEELEQAVVNSPEGELAEDTVEDQETEEYEDEAEDMEQPDEDEDSDDNASDEEETEDYDEADDPEEDNEEADTEDKVETEPQPVQNNVTKFKANGKEFEFTDEEIKAQFPNVFGQAMDYTKKMQAIKPWRKQIDALEQQNIQPEDLNLMIDVLQGNKEALTEVIKRTGVDPFELDTESQSNYVPKDYGRDSAALDLQEVITSIQSDPEYVRTQNVLNNDWDERSWEVMKNNPNMIRGLHIDIKSGRFDELAGQAEKLKFYDGGGRSDLEYYMEAARLDAPNVNVRAAKESISNIQQNVAAKLAAKQKEIATVKESQAKSNATKAKASRRKAATPVAKTAGNKNVVDYLDDSDEAFEEWYKNLQDSQ